MTRKLSEEDRKQGVKSITRKLKREQTKKYGRAPGRWKTFHKLNKKKVGSWSVKKRKTTVKKNAACKRK